VDDAPQLDTERATEGLVAHTAVFPNPARTQLTVQISAAPTQLDAGAAPARVSIYDVRGRLVRTLPAIGNAATRRWDLASEDGTPVPRGVYFVRVETPLERTTHKVLLIE